MQFFSHFVAHTRKIAIIINYGENSLIKSIELRVIKLIEMFYSRVLDNFTDEVFKEKFEQFGRIF